MLSSVSTRPNWIRKSSDVCCTSALVIVIPRRSASRIARRQISTFFSDTARGSLHALVTGAPVGDGTGGASVLWPDAGGRIGSYSRASSLDEGRDEFTIDNQFFAETRPNDTSQSPSRGIAHDARGERSGRRFATTKGWDT